MHAALAATGLSLLLAAAPHAPPAHRAAPVAGSLVSLITTDDYPNAALRNEEQGTVAVALEVDPKGNVSSCTVTTSSGSDSLDTSTCRLMIERAHFTPAHDRRGRAVRDIYAQKITWRISAGSSRDPRLDAAAQAWVDCLLAEARRQASGADSAERVADRAFAACPQGERGMLAAMTAVAPPGAAPTTQVPPAVRAAIRGSVLKGIAQLRGGAN
jgi:TonB family protein